ncbi:INPP5E [Symbiodinium natans]|uniref:INPP5E protein n=1 Tax=Symbiodinium natans TaxID=878477 RepID=A0A812VCJ9_9DINO|nr:INPP5E [Symbiodinium natans]
MAAAAVAQPVIESSEVKSALPGAQEEHAVYVDDEVPSGWITEHDHDDASQRSPSLESVRDKTRKAPAPAAGETQPPQYDYVVQAQPDETPPDRQTQAELEDAGEKAREVHVEASRPRQQSPDRKAMQELPPGAIGQAASPGSEVEDASPPSEGESPVAIPEPTSPASPSSKTAFHRWEEAEVASLGGGSKQAVRLFCGVWNLHGKKAPANLNQWVPTSPRHHIYVVGTCECERTIEKSLIWSSKARWESQMCRHLGEDFRMIGSHNMSAIHVMVFIHRSLWRYCWEARTCQVATGFANLVGNKGGTQVSFRVGNTTMLFVNAHLAAHANKMKERTQNLHRILADSPLRSRKDLKGVHEEYDRVFVMGDLNTRVDASRAQVDEWIMEKQFDKCLAKDQLLPLLKGDPGSGSAGFWPDFEEAEINFPPTYKFDKHSDIYDSSKKQRVPSWTDRILWRRDPHIKSLAYDSVPFLQCSDHRPVFAQFEVMVDVEDWSGPPIPDQSGRKSSVCCVQ